jgi:hypothetical protein
VTVRIKASLIWVKEIGRAGLNTLKDVKIILGRARKTKSWIDTS